MVKNDIFAISKMGYDMKLQSLDIENILKQFDFTQIGNNFPWIIILSFFL